MLLSTGMSNIYLKFTIEKNSSSQNFDFRSLKDLSRGQFLGVFGQLPPRKIAPRLGLGFGLGLALELRLGGNFPRGQLS